MAATRLIALHVNKGKTAAASIRDRLDYALNSEKTQKGEFISAYECDPYLAWREFSLAREMYLQQNVRTFERDVIGYQIRQSFKPGEITPEEANKVGYETAMRFTKGKHAFTVSTHVDRAHIHNHIIFCSVSLDGDRKFRDFWRSGLALQKVSNLVCMEHRLSVIPKRSEVRGQQESGQNKPRQQRQRRRVDSGFSLMIDIEAKLREGKGIGYEKWAKSFNTKQSAEVLLYLQERGIDSWQKLYEKENVANDRFHELSEEIRVREARLKELGNLKKAIVEYSKTRPVFEAYRKTGYSEKFFESHRAEITIHRAEAFSRGVDAADEILPGIREEILTGSIKPTDQAVAEVGKADEESREKLARKLRKPRDPIMRQILEISESMLHSEGIAAATDDDVICEMKDALESLIWRWNNVKELYVWLLKKEPLQKRIMELVEEANAFITDVGKGAMWSDNTGLPEDNISGNI